MELDNEKPIYKQDRFYLSRNSYLEVNWNEMAWKDDMLKIVINEESVIIPRQDLETYMLYLAKDPSRFMRSSSKIVETRQIPVPDSIYKKNQYLKKQGFVKSIF